MMINPHSIPDTGLDASLDRVRWLPFAARPINALCFPAVESVQRHWDSVRAGRTAPARAEIDPRPLADALDVVFIAELFAPGIARMRLCGNHFAELLGMEPRGMPLSVFFALDARDGISNALAQVAQGARATIPLRAEKGLGRPALDGLLALMPLADHSGTITRVLGVLETQGQIGKAPRRFRLSAPINTVQDPSTTAPRQPGKPVLQVIRGGLT